MCMHTISLTGGGGVNNDELKERRRVGLEFSWPVYVYIYIYIYIYVYMYICIYIY
jgi:hypothetical protein